MSEYAGSLPRATFVYHALGVRAGHGYTVHVITDGQTNGWRARQSDRRKHRKTDGRTERKPSFKKKQSEIVADFSCVATLSPMQSKTVAETLNPKLSEKGADFPCVPTNGRKFGNDF